MRIAICIVAALLILPCQAEARHLHHTSVHHAYLHHAYVHHAYVRHAYVRHAYTRHAYFRRAYAQRAYGSQNYDVQNYGWQNNFGSQNFRQAMASMDSNDRVVGSRPVGCPHAFCGCEASLYKFGRIIPELNLASNWRRFPRAAPSPGMAAVRPGHVMILQQQISGNIWVAHDGNSGSHMTREHAVSIAGYTIVDPSAATTRFASARFM